MSPKLAHDIAVAMGISSCDFANLGAPQHDCFLRIVKSDAHFQKACMGAGLVNSGKPHQAMVHQTEMSRAEFQEFLRGVDLSTGAPNGAV